MKNLILSSLFFLLPFHGLFAQAADSPASRHHQVDLSYGFGEEVGMVRAAYTHYWGIGKRKRFHIGAGARFMTAFGSDWRMAEVNTDNTGDGGLDQDALLSEDLVLGGLNLGLYLKYEIGSKIELGLNFDVLGLGFASTGPTQFVQADNGETTTVEAISSPAPSIAFTRGQVSSDNLWIGYKLPKNFRVRLGFNFTGLELEVDDLPVVKEDQRFERINTMAIIGLGYSF